jgi:hypothetical protein
MNISDLVNQIFTKFIDKFISLNTPETDAVQSDSLNKSKYGIASCTYIGVSELGVYDIIHDIVDETVAVLNIHYLYNDTTIQQDYVLYDSAMDSIYSKCVSNIFDKFIVNFVNENIKSNIIYDLYDMLYYSCYNEPVENKPDLQTMYTFCTNILREIMNSELPEFRKALAMLAKNAALIPTGGDFLYNIAKDDSINLETMLDNKTLEEIKYINDNRGE